MTTVQKTTDDLKARFEKLQREADDILEAWQHAKIEHRPTTRLEQQHLRAQQIANEAYRELEIALSKVN